MSTIGFPRKWLKEHANKAVLAFMLALSVVVGCAGASIKDVGLVSSASMLFGLSLGLLIADHYISHTTDDTVMLCGKINTLLDEKMTLYRKIDGLQDDLLQALEQRNHVLALFNDLCDRWSRTD